MRVPVVRELAARRPACPAGRSAPATARRRRPSVDRLVVGLEHRHPQPVVVDAVALGDELVGPRDRLGLEVVGEREVAEHLEERLVAGVMADVLDVVRAHHLLRR